MCTHTKPTNTAQVDACLFVCLCFVQRLTTSSTSTIFMAGTRDVRKRKPGCTTASSGRDPEMKKPE